MKIDSVTVALYLRLQMNFFPYLPIFFVDFGYWKSSFLALFEIVGVVKDIQRDSKRWTQFLTSIFRELYIICE